MRIKVFKLNTIVKALELVALLIGIPAAFMFVFDLQDRLNDRTAQSWELLAIETSGASGKKEAMEFLNSKSAWYEFPKKERASLSGLDLSTERWPGAYLNKLYLEEADMSFANFNMARIKNSTIDSAEMDFASFESVEFENVKLNNLDVVSVSFTGSRFVDLQMSNSIIENSCLIKIQLPFESVRSHGYHNFDITDVIISKSSLKGSDLSMLTGKNIWILDSDLSNVVVDEHGSFNANLDVSENNVDKVVDLFKENRHLDERGTSYPGPGALIGSSKSWYLLGNEPTGVDLSLLDALTMEQYIDRYMGIKSDTPCLDQIYTEATMYYDMREVNPK